MQGSPEERGAAEGDAGKSGLSGLSRVAEYSELLESPLAG